jgi:hypothetical protein
MSTIHVTTAFFIILSFVFFLKNTEIPFLLYFHSKKNIAVGFAAESGILYFWRFGDKP